MTDKSEFTTEEWSALISSPFLAGMAVTLAEPSGLWGMLQEGMASAKTMLEAKSAAGSNPLVKAIAEELSKSEGRSASHQAIKAQLTAKTAAEVKQQVIAALANVGELADRKAAADAPAFKAWLKHISERVAEASTEGGFLGFGGVKVSDAEKATLSEVGKALKV